MYASALNFTVNPPQTIESNRKATDLNKNPTTWASHGLSHHIPMGFDTMPAVAVTWLRPPGVSRDGSPNVRI